MSITLTAKAFRKAVVAQLVARSVGTIVHTRVRDIPDTDFVAGTPFVNVFSTGNRGTSAGGKQAHLPRFHHSETIMIACQIRLADSVARTAVDEALGDAIDDLETAVFDALFTNRAFNEVAFSGYVVQKGGSVHAGGYRGDLVIELTSEWLRKTLPGPEPGTADAIFRRAHVQIDVDRDKEYQLPETAHRIDGIYPMLDWSQPTQGRNTYYLAVI